MATWLIVVLVFAGIVWAIGAFHYLDEMLENGKSLRDYRKKYGKDLGMLVCIFHRSFTVLVWPIWGTGGFLVGVVRDGIRLAFGSTPADLDK